MPLLLTKGTKEYLAVEIVDKLGNLTDLDSTDVKFEIRDEGGLLITGWDAADTITGTMTALCLVDTTSMDEGTYRLFIRFEATPQEPVLGPYTFAIESYSNDLS